MIKRLENGTILLGGQPIYSPQQGDSIGKVTFQMIGATALIAAGAATAIFALAM